MHEKEVKREIMNLNSKKQHATVLCQSKFLNNFATHIFPIITKIINESITEGDFPSALKLTEVTPVFLKNGLHEQGELLSHMPKDPV